MEEHHIDIEIKANGEVKVHIKGAKGRQCLEYADFFKKIVGQIKEQTLTHEHYEPEPRLHLNLEEHQQVHEKEW
jgi:hypothetical protein